jgi:dTDP-4-dehydrorhamnose reductase
MTDRSKILVLGHCGMLGRDLMEILPQSTCYEVVGADINEVDIAEPGSISQYLAQVAPDVVINTAALTNVEGCEVNPTKAYHVNTEGAYHVALACQQLQIRLIHISTDYVFDGKSPFPYTEEVSPGPLNIYGWSKLAGELAVRAALPDAMIVRTAWLYGWHGKNFVKTMMTLGQQKNELTVVDDQIGCPTFTHDLCHALSALIVDGKPGIYHAVGEGRCSWYEFACTIFKLTNMNHVHVRPIKTVDLNLRAVRPAFSVLDCTKLAEATNFIMSPWEQALQQYLQFEYA